MWRARALVSPLPVVSVPLDDALGRVLAHDVVALWPSPPFTNSAMDGYALQGADAAAASADAPVLLTLVGEAAAGRPFEGTVSAGQAVSIMTGAVVPEGADAVVPIERASDGRTNPMVNPGAIATVSLVPGADSEARWRLIHETLSRFAGRPLALDEEVLRSALQTNHRNRSAAALLHTYGRLATDPEEAVELYTRVCSLSVTAHDLAVMGARELRDNSTVFTGVGAPMMASVLAQRTHAPNLTMMVEGGVIGPMWKPGELPISTNEMRAAYRAQMLPGISDAFLLAQRGFFDVGFIGGAQIDQHGNLNTSAIGGYARPKVRLPGSGGANDIISLCREVMILTVHEKRRFTERVDFVTSPGYLDGGDARARHGLLFGGVSRVITTLGLFGFEARSRRMQLLALHPGATLDQVRDNTGFEVLVSPDLTTTKPPTDEELSILRMLDPKRQFIG